MVTLLAIKTSPPSESVAKQPINMLIVRRSSMFIHVANAEIQFANTLKGCWQKVRGPRGANRVLPPISASPAYRVGLIITLYAISAQKLWANSGQESEEIAAPVSNTSPHRRFAPKMQRCALADESGSDVLTALFADRRFHVHPSCSVMRLPSHGNAVLNTNQPPRFTSEIKMTSVRLISV